MNDARAFLEALDRDDALRARMRGASADALVGLAAEAGFDFTFEQFQAAMKADMSRPGVMSVTWWVR